MGRGTTIEWCDVTWPVVNGCRRVSPGCGRARGKGGCYAEQLIATRLRHMPKYEGLAVYGENGPRWTGESRLWWPDLTLPLTIRRPSRIFVANMGDLFYDKVTDREIDQVFGVMWACRWIGRGDGQPGHQFQVLTKRPERMRDYLGADRAALARRWADAAVAHGGGDDPDRLWDSIVFETEAHPRIWLGVSVETREYLWRIDVLREIDAAVRFVSFEPLLEDLGEVNLAGIHQGIVGGESGNGADPMNIAWAVSLVRQMTAAGTCRFVKQLGSVPVMDEGEWRRAGGGRLLTHRNAKRAPADTVPIAMLTRKGGDFENFPPELQYREFPQ